MVVSPTASQQHARASDAAAEAAARRQQVARQERLRVGLADWQGTTEQGIFGSGGNASHAGRVLQHAGTRRRNSDSREALQQHTITADDAGSNGGSNSRALQQIVSIRGNSSGGDDSWELSAHDSKSYFPGNLLGSPQQTVRAAYFLWASALNLVAVSTMWARAADVFDAGAAAR